MVISKLLSRLFVSLFLLLAQAFVLKAVWASIAWELNLPTFSFWVYLGIIWILDTANAVSHSDPKKER